MSVYFSCENYQLLGSVRVVMHACFTRLFSLLGQYPGIFGIFVPGIVANLVDYVVSKISTCMSKKWQFGIIGSDR